MITEATKRLIERVVNVFETGRPEGKYDSLVVMADGKDKSRQITYGRSQTTEQGNLKKLLQMYVTNGGVFSAQLSAYIGRLGIEPLADDVTLKDTLQQAARQDPIMKRTQDEFFEEAYYNPALGFFNTNGFLLPLSLLVIYDSYIHSGGMRDFLRQRFPEVVPTRGGEEKAWITSYVGVRHDWLANHENELLRRTIYRTQCFKDQIAADNWNLDKLPIMAHGVAVNVAPIT